MARARGWHGGMAVAGAVVLLAGCASSDGGGGKSPRADASTPSASSGPHDLSVCEPGPGKTVTMLDDVVIPEQEIPAVEATTVTVSGKDVDLPGVPAATIPERVAKAGCVVTYDAPGGCLGAVEISGTSIPAYTVPERRLAGVTLADGTVLDERVLPATTVKEVKVDGVRQDEVCQVTDDKEAGDYVASVYRPSLYRASLYQASTYQASAYRPSARSGDTTVPSVSVPSASAPSMSVPSQSVPSATLKSFRMEGTDDVEQTMGSDDTTSYTTSGDVLFGSDEDALRPEATEPLKAILAQIQTRPDATILVEGHTDNVDSEQHNLDLSQRRAEAVAAWLVANGVDRSQITTVGYGFAHPRADNSTEEGRAANRRVVITVTG